MATENTPNSPGIKRNIVQPTTKEEAQKRYLPAVHGKATDAMATMGSRDLVVNTLNNTASANSREVKLVINQFNRLAGTLGISTHKLLSMGLSEFTKMNHTGSISRETRELRVAFPLKEYAFRCGYDVYEHETKTEEEAGKEKKRAENELKNARKKINKDLDLLYNASLSWKEKVRGKTSDYLDVRIIGGKGIKKGYVYMEFTQTMGDYLIGLPLSQYSLSLLAIDGRNPNAYFIGLKMVEHFNMDNNQRSGTAQLLKVSSLLSGTNLPDINDSSVKEHGWVDRIKEPFENALDVLTSSGVLEDWRYSHSKGAEMTDEEATNFSDYEEWAETLVYFTLKNAPDHTSRLETKTERIEKNQERAGKKKPGRGKKSN